MQQLNAIAVADTQQAGLRQKLRRPRAMGLERAKQAGALRQAWKEPEVVALEPAIECPLTNAFEGKQNAQSCQFTGIQRTLHMLGYGTHDVINSTPSAIQ
jgi:hypothetical protein